MIDKETKPKFVSITIEDTKDVLKELRDTAEANSLRENDNEPTYMQLSDENFSVECEEYYFEDGDIHFSTNMASPKGQANIYMTIPLSDKVLIDILAHSIKKFNKLKTVLESLDNG